MNLAGVTPFVSGKQTITVRWYCKNMTQVKRIARLLTKEFAKYPDNPFFAGATITPVVNRQLAHDHAYQVVVSRTIPRDQLFQMLLNLDTTIRYTHSRAKELRGLPHEKFINNWTEGNIIMYLELLAQEALHHLEGVVRGLPVAVTAVSQGRLLRSLRDLDHQKTKERHG